MRAEGIKAQTPTLGQNQLTILGSFNLSERQPYGKVKINSLHFEVSMPILNMLFAILHILYITPPPPPLLRKFTSSIFDIDVGITRKANCNSNHFFIFHTVL